MRIILVVRELGVQVIMEEFMFDESDGVNCVFGFFSWFLFFILIVVYISLFLQYFIIVDGDEFGWIFWVGDVGGSIWWWINLMVIMGFYVIELYFGGDGDGGVYWKMD